MEAVALPSGVKIRLEVFDCRTNERIMNERGKWENAHEAAPELFHYCALILGHLGVATDIPRISRTITRAHWSVDDDKRLLELVAQKASNPMIAYELGRTEQAIVKRRWRLAKMNAPKSVNN